MGLPVFQYLGTGSPAQTWDLTFIEEIAKLSGQHEG
jgi:hypothetical protein